MAPHLQIDTTFGSGEAASSLGESARSFAFGGVRFEIAPEAGLDWRLPEASGEYVLPAESATCAAVECALQLDGRLPELAPSEKGLSIWESTAEGLRVRTAALALDVRRMGPARFVSSARLGEPKAAGELLVLLASALLELSGGLCLHATAVEFEGRALLLLGPSGAGKTTAAQLLGGMPCVAFDRVALVPSANGAGYAVWALPGGSPPRLARSRARVLPLAGFVRIVQAYEKPSVRPLGVGESALYLREAVEIGVGAGFLEARRLETISSLALAAAGGRAEVVLGQSWAPALRSFLAGAAPIAANTRVEAQS